MVPSTLMALTGLESGVVSRFNRWASWVSMKLPVDPLSIHGGGRSNGCDGQLRGSVSGRPGGCRGVVWDVDWGDFLFFEMK